MFGSNPITGQKAFKDAPMNSLLVTSIFFTLQGEGPFSGQRAVFVRLAKCNLACSFCDTAFDKGEWLTFDEIEQQAWHAIDGQAVENGQDPTDMVLVITGGEPTLQANLTGFLHSQMGKWDQVQIESNGLIERQLPIGATLVVSPKCSEPMLPGHGSIKRGHYLKPKPDVLQRADCLKFVVDANPLNAYHRPPQWADQWAYEMKRPVYVSPMNAYQEGKPLTLLKMQQTLAETLTDREATERVSFWTPGLLDRERNQANHEHAAQLCLQHGYRLSLQTHLYASLP
jgi:organic radical activating enzyme